MNILKNKTLQFGFVALAALISINLWSFQKIDAGIFKVAEVSVILALVVIIITNTYVFTKKNLLFKTNALLFILFPCLSALGAYLYHNQSFSLSFLLLLTNFLWLFYFVLHIFEIPKKKIIHLMTFIGCVWAFLTIVQQFTYPTAFFYTRDDESQSIFRAGVYRYMLSGQQYGIFVLLYFFYKFLTSTNSSKIYNLLFVLAGLVGFYYFGTRQFAVSAIMCMGVALLFVKATTRAKYIALMLPIILIVWVFKDVLFSQYIELTNRQMQYGYEQDIRVLCADFYLNDYWPHWVTKIIGNGPPHMLSDYGREMNLILAYFHFYRSDVGIIGTYNKFGLLHVLNIFWVCIKALRLNVSNEDKYLKLFFFNVLFLLITNETFSSERVIPFYCFIFYLMDKSVQEQKEKARP